jgi:cytoskeleton protein RodZ
VSDLNDHNKEIHKAASAIPPGTRLRQAREAKNLSLEEVASHLRLSVEKIASLESGKVATIDAPVFVSGYLRAYAKLVGLPGDEVIADFDALEEMDSPSMDPTNSPAANDYGLVATPSFAQRIGAVASGGSKAIILGSVIVVLIVMYIYAKDSFITKSANNDVKLKDDFTQQNNIESKFDDTKNEVLTSQKAEDTSPKVQGNEIQGKKNFTNQKLVSGSSGQSDLSFNFNEDSWIEVTDATGQRLLYRLGKAGTTETVRGEAPFHIQLGYAPGVSISYNGEPYDLSRYANRRTANFHVGSSGDSKTKEQ